MLLTTGPSGSALTFEQITIVQLELGPNPKKTRRSKAAGKFLEDNPFAKIVIILSTHSSEDGQFVTNVTKASVYTDVIGPVRAQICRWMGKLTRQIRSFPDTFQKRCTPSLPVNLTSTTTTEH
jgi:hypothetical protein